MEFKISQFVKWFAAFMAFYFSLLVLDEFLKAKPVVDSYQDKYIVETEFSDRVVVNYFIKTQKDYEIEVAASVYDSLKPKQPITIYFSPLFKQKRGYELKRGNLSQATIYGNPNEYRGTHLFTTIPVVILCFFSAFVIQRFDLKIALFFFACLTAAVRWWILGMS